MRRPRFWKFVERVLAVSGNSSIEKFSVICRVGSPTRRWIRDVLLNRGGVFDLELRQGDYPVDLPWEIFTCKTLVKLKLTGFCIDEELLPEDASLPALKKLFLNSVQFDSSLLRVCAFGKLLSACPVLEELVLDDLNWDQWKWSRSVSSPSLRKLTINRSDFDGFDGSHYGNITIDTPSLTHLDYSDFVPSSYLVVNLNSLVEANLHLIDIWYSRCYAPEYEHITSDPTNLFKAMTNVQIINLLSHGSLEMFYHFRSAIPVFENLFHSSITTFSDHCTCGLVYLLNNCPNLETLTIKGTLDYDPDMSTCDCLSGYSFLVPCPVKVVKITEYEGSTLLKIILEKLSHLELLEVSILDTDDMKFQKAKDLLMLPRASSKCKIKVN